MSRATALFRPTTWALRAGRTAALEPPRRRSSSRAASAVAWALGLFVVGQLVLGIAMYTVRTDLRDPEYSLKLAGLRELRRRNPDSPLVVLLGSSRVARGLRPDVLMAHCPAGNNRPVVFNFSLLGSGPIMQLLCLNRLLADGVRPDHVVVECWPPFCHQEKRLDVVGDPEEERLDVNRLSLGDVDLLARYHSDPAGLRRRWWDAQLAPAYSHRLILLSHYRPAWLPWNMRLDGNWSDIDAGGWQYWRPARNTGTRADRVQGLRQRFGPLLATFRFPPLSDRAYREIFERCRREGIGVSLVYMPEASDFQDLYPPVVWAGIEAELVCLSEEYEVAMIDARSWSADDDFCDAIHLTPEGAQALSERFGREVLPRLLAAPRGQRLDPQE